MRSDLIARRFCALGLLLATLSAAQSVQTAPKTANARPAELGLPITEVHSYKEFNDFGQVWQILQDKRGVMFFGHGGPTLLEYDGVSWRKIAMPGNQSRSISMDSAGKIWVGSVGNVGYLEPDASGTLKYVSLNDKIPESDRNFTVVFQTLATPQGIFYQTFEKIFRWDGKTMHVWSARPDQRFQAISLVNGRIYTSQTGIGLEEIAGDGLRSLPGGDAYKNSRKLFLYPYNGNQILVSERKGLLTLYDGHKSAPFNTQADSYFRNHEVFTSTVLPDGAICVTMIGGGVMILEHDGRLRRFIDKTDGLLDSDGLVAFMDRDGALWVGTSTGVTRVEINSPVSFLAKYFTEDVARFQGKLYTISEGGIAGVPLSRINFDPLTNRIAMTPIQGPTQDFSFTLFKDPSGKTPDQLLVATNDGLYMLQGDTLLPAMAGVHGAPEQVYDMTVSKANPNRVFIGHGNGIGSMRWDGRRWIDEGRLPNTIYEARTLAEDAEGRLWVAGNDGYVLRIKVAETGMQDSKAEAIGKREGLPAGLTGVASMAGSIYAAVFRTDAIFRWDEKNHKFAVDNQFLLPLDGSSTSPILTELPDGSTWAGNSDSDSRRLARIHRQRDGIWTLDEPTYKALTHYAVNPAFVDPDGTAWFAGEYLIRLAPQAQATAPQPFQTLVRQVQSGSKTIFGGMLATGDAEVRLPAGTSALTFQFAALSYQNSEDNSYQYMLEGADKDWSAWGKQKEANYNGLGPGSYLFHVRSRSSDGQMGEEGTYSFVILPPWYRSGPAYVAYAVLFVFLGIIGWLLISRHERAKARRRTEALEAEARVLEATVSERTAEIRARAAELVTINRISQALATQLDKNRLIQFVGDQVREMFHAPIAYVSLLDRASMMLQFPYTFGEDAPPRPYGTGLTSQIIRTGQPLLINEDMEGSSARLGVEQIGRRTA
ncbi:MAG TPA: triple tyrosine motif-containing protein, partial [Terracidiphilus sp.]